MRFSRAMAMLRRVFLLVIGGSLTTGCLTDALDLSGFACDDAHPCPGELICVCRPVSASAVAGTCLTADRAPACVPNERLCNPDQNWIEECQPDGHSTRLVASCAADQACQPDVALCVHACERDVDCGSGETCDTGLGLCRPLPDCMAGACDGICVGRACVPIPQGQISTESGVVDLDCFTVRPSSPPDTPVTCDLTGRVSLFPVVDPDKTIGLSVELSPAEDPTVVLQTAVVEDVDGKGQYTLTDVVTNREYALRIPAGQSLAGEQVVTTIRAGVVLRADRCEEGLALAAMRKSTYDLFAGEIMGPVDERRGLLIGRAADCNLTRRPMAEVAVGLTITPVPPAGLYYFAATSHLQPDPGLSATSVKGYFGAGLPACRNEVGYLGQQGTTPIPLGKVGFVLPPGSAVIADLPLPGGLIP